MIDFKKLCLFDYFECGNTTNFKIITIIVIIHI